MRAHERWENNWLDRFVGHALLLVPDHILVLLRINSCFFFSSVFFSERFSRIVVDPDLVLFRSVM